MLQQLYPLPILSIAFKNRLFPWLRKQINFYVHDALFFRRWGHFGVDLCEAFSTGLIHSIPDEGLKILLRLNSFITLVHNIGVNRLFRPPVC